MRQARRIAEQLALQIVPDLAGRPLYIIWPGELGEVGTHQALRGCTSPHFDLLARPALERLGQWQGRGLALMLDPATIAAESDHRPRHARRRAFWPAFLGVFLHELSHLLAEPPRREMPAAAITLGRELLAAELAGERVVPAGELPFAGHGPEFIRIALHLAHRAREVGEHLHDVDLIDTAMRGLSYVHSYREALGLECSALLGAPFARIRATPAPPAFRRLWRRDVLAFAATASPAQRRAIARNLEVIS